MALAPYHIRYTGHSLYFNIEGGSSMQMKKSFCKRPSLTFQVLEFLFLKQQTNRVST